MDKSKIIAFYLPQFHEVQENNEWWGKGHTEWKCIKEYSQKCKEKFSPRLPLDDNYYNLLDENVMQWQADLAKKYGIDGFAYYHYWMNGKLLLEKPAENLLQWKNVDQKFCFFWANHTWYKSVGSKKEILAEQKYGGIDEWNRHYEYLRKFFLDSRYIKYENKPVLGIYRPEDVIDYDKMLKYFDDRAVLDGFEGLYIIESASNPNAKKVSTKAEAIVWRQSDIARKMYATEDNKSIFILAKKAINKVRKQFGVSWETRYKYERMASYEESLITYPVYGKTFFCVDTGWNNMPRHGNFGQVIADFSLDRFHKLFKTMYIESCKRGNELFFINAWNEWAEGMNLEPDSKYGYGLLEIVRKVKDGAIGHFERSNV